MNLKVRAPEIARWLIVYMLVEIIIDFIVAPKAPWYLSVVLGYAAAIWSQQRYNDLGLDKEKSSV